MSNESAVQCQHNSRIHIGVATKDLDESVAFYRALLGQEPTKTRPGYAKFEVAEPRLNLTLNEVVGETGPNNSVAHFGIQVKSTEAVKEVTKRLSRTDIITKIEDNVTCCYAVQNKVWATDPDGNSWEVYVVLDDNGAHHHSSTNDCCSERPARIEARQRGDITSAKSAFETAGGIACVPACRAGRREDRGE